MRAVSPHARFSLQLIEAPVKRGLDQSGNVVEYADTKPIVANFAQLGLHEWEQIAVLEYFNFSGLPEGVNPLSTIGVYDSEAQGMALGWDEKMQKSVDERLEFLAKMNPASLIIVPTPAKLPPWRNYDHQDVQTIYRLFQETGADPEVVRLYEHENQGRQEIIQTMEALQRGENPFTGLAVGASKGDPQYVEQPDGSYKKLQEHAVIPVIPMEPDEQYWPGNTNPELASPVIEGVAGSNPGVIVGA
jgi:hypothetical protein